MARTLLGIGTRSVPWPGIRKRTDRLLTLQVLMMTVAVNAYAGGRIETVPVESDDAAIPSREVRVWLPEAYDEGEGRYPVVYFHDGQNVFRPGGPFGCWFAEDTAAEEMKAGRVREAIIVAVPNNEADLGKARVTEYQPPDDVNPRDPSRGPGLCDRYANFLVGKVKPAIDGKYRTLPDRADTVVAGSSMGGLVSLWLGLNTDVFGAVGVFSPAFWTSPNFTKAVMEGAKKDGLRIYMDMGTRERGNLNGDYWQDALAVREALLRQGYQEETDFLWNPGEGDEHNEKAWAKRLPVALRFLMAKEKDKPRIKED
jgi:predicted alpha/beta superfamily hydrolase